MMTLTLSSPPPGPPPPARGKLRHRGGTIIPPVDAVVLAELYDRRRPVLCQGSDDLADSRD